MQNMIISLSQFLFKFVISLFAFPVPILLSVTFVYIINHLGNWIGESIYQSLYFKKKVYLGGGFQMDDLFSLGGGLVMFMLFREFYWDIFTYAYETLIRIYELIWNKNV